ncbi:MAG TPA: MjaI family restriction endonuclease [Bacilli bacterium]|nr:MjaI family restriction endonuclease [Bacilli bacterium]
MKIQVPNTEIQELLSGRNYSYPKYVTQILNLANQNSQGTRPNVVGQMSDLIQEFEGITLAEWEKWYTEGHPDAIDRATDRVYNMVSLFKEAIVTIDKDTVRRWVEELVIVKTFVGLKFQEVILQKLSLRYNMPYRLASTEEESQGIDGFIGETPISIKPETYRIERNLNEVIAVPIIYYDKQKSQVVFSFDERIFEGEDLL